MEGVPVDPTNAFSLGNNPLPFSHLSFLSSRVYPDFLLTALTNDH